jgi:serine/threonine-protein kinase
MSDVHPVPKGYEFIRVVGAGGYGEVVLAKHRTLGREVAIKRIHSRYLSDQVAMDRFRREAQVLASTTCQSVVKVYDLVREDLASYLVMEYVRGSSLSELLDDGPLPAEHGIPILADVAEALKVMAAQGVVHRDVKPGNVFVLEDGSAKLGDFGLARALNDPTIFRTEGPSDLGTPAYFPPEVSQGGAEPDGRSDAYSFAVMAYEVLTGHLPYDAPTPIAMMTAHWLREPTPPSDHLPGFPAGATDVLNAGLAKDPETRAMPSELVERLSAVPASAWPEVERTVGEKDAPSVAFTRRPSTVTAPKLPSRRRPRQWVGLVVPILVVAAALLVFELVSRS